MRSIIFISIFSIIIVGCSNKNSNKHGENCIQYSDSMLLDSVQYKYFQYFWDGAEENSGLARERYHEDGIYPENDKNIVTTGGSGFGLMAMIVGVERGFISRDQAIDRFEKIIEFLEHADRFHGAWPHWLDGKTGKVKPFSKYDDGGDIVETSFLIQGLITVKNYLNNRNKRERIIAAKIDEIWREVEWNWYTKGGENILYWHWSPNVGWKMNFGITGYNECFITYILAAASPTYPINDKVYHEGWAQKGKIKIDANNTEYSFGLRHHIDSINGGPLFWSHYSFLGLDPHGLKDSYADYWENNVAHTMINREHCIKNPYQYKGYGENCWGLTSSYSVPGAARYFMGQTDVKPKKGKSEMTGYAGHSPSFDLGVIAPTAALSSIPYAPDEVMKVLRHFYCDLGDKILGKYGFYDAFSIEYEWFPKKYLAIDQGTVPVMIENYRTGLLWSLFMNDRDIQNGLIKLKFNSPYLKK